MHQFLFLVQEEVEKLAPLQGQLDDALVQVKSLEETRGWLEHCHKEAENNTESTRTYYESVIGCLKTEHSEEVHQLKLLYDNQEKVMIIMLDNIICRITEGYLFMFSTIALGCVCQINCML